jgi:ATP-dependent Lon protease
MKSVEAVPVIPLRDLVVFPHTMMPVVLGRQSSIRAFDDALLKNRRVFVAAQRDASVEEPQPSDIYPTGCMASVVQEMRLPDGTVKAFLRGIDRARVVEWTGDRGFLGAIVAIIPAVPGGRDQARMRSVHSLFTEYLEFADTLPHDEMMGAIHWDDPSELADTIAVRLNISVDDKQDLVEIASPTGRLAHLERLLMAELRRLRTLPESVERRRQRMREQQLLRRAVKRALQSADIAEHAERLDRAARPILMKTSSSSSDQSLFGERGLSNAGMQRLRELLECHTLVLDVAQMAFFLFLTMLDEQEDRPFEREDQEPGNSLRLIWLQIASLRRDAADVWAAFGIEGSSN